MERRGLEGGWKEVTRGWKEKETRGVEKRARAKEQKKRKGGKEKQMRTEGRILKAAASDDPLSEINNNTFFYQGSIPPRNILNLNHR
ncbi:hypothetical protein M0802_008245 [Mischocyttarus mexicanus]|nr:hypothetical protein M0802_008245 [Mischocyttarus mexicanus]